MNRFFAVPIVCAAMLFLTACPALEQKIAAFEQRAAPAVAQACTLFHQAEADPAVQLALAGGQVAAGLVMPGSGAAIGAGVKLARSYGERFCAEGPPAGDASSAAQQAAWLADITMKMLGAAGALH